MDRRDLLLVLIGAGDESVAGITRLQKYLFLLEREYGVKTSGAGINFEPYRFGPYAPEIYDDIQYLQNIGFLEPKNGPEGAGGEDAEDMDFNFLAPSRLVSAGPSDEELVEREGFYAGSYEGPDTAAKAAEGDLGPERLFRLTAQARKYLDEQLSHDPAGQEVVEACREVKGRFPSLNSLIRYVYNRYPEYVSESEIREKILGE